MKAQDWQQLHREMINAMVTHAPFEAILGDAKIAPFVKVNINLKMRFLDMDKIFRSLGIHPQNHVN